MSKVKKYLNKKYIKKTAKYCLYKLPILKKLFGIDFYRDKKFLFSFDF